MTRPFVGIPSFLRAPIVTDLDSLDADIAVLGAPTDEGSPFIPGSRFGPRGMREQSMRFGAYGAGYYDVDARQSRLEREMSAARIVDVGDADIVPTDVVGSFANITELTKRVLDRGAFPVVLGGDHAISYPVVRAFAGRKVHVVHFDAHLDYAPFIHGLQYTNGHAFRHIAHMDHVASLTQIGIRGLRNPRVWMEDSLADGNKVITMQEFRQSGAELLKKVVPPNEDYYISLDIDVLDSSLVPGCVSAEPNGMAYSQLHEAMAALTEHGNVIGLDVVEVNPLTDVASGITSYIAAHAIVEFLGKLCDQPRWRSAHADSPTTV